MERIGRQARRWTVVLTALLGVLTVTLAVWRWQRAKDVDVTHPIRVSIVESIASSGRVRGVTETLVGAQTTGLVEQLFVRDGDRVSRGQRLAILKNDVAEARVAQAEAALTTAQATLLQVSRGPLASELEAAAAEVREARAQLEQQRASLVQAEQSVIQAQAQLALLQEERDLAAKQLERSERLLERGLVAKAEHDEAFTRFRVAGQRVAAQRQGLGVAEAAVRAVRGGGAAAEANVGVQEARLRTLETGARPEDVAIARQQVREAERALAVARRQAQEAVVVAPFGGVVTAINAEVGQTVGASGVLRLVSTEMEIRVDVDEGNLADLLAGQPAVISSSTFPGTAFDGTVRDIAAAVDQARGTVTVTVTPLKPPPWLRPGQTVNVNIVTNRAAERLLVPAATLRRAGDRSVVLAVEDGRAIEKTVLTRPPTADGVPVVSGLSADDRIIINPSAIQAGDRVRVRRRADEGAVKRGGAGTVRRGLGFETQVAIRHLRSGGGQTWLTISAVAAAVIIVIFVTGLIFGLERKWTNLLTEAIPHVTVRVPDPKPTPLSRVPGGPAGPSSSRLEQLAPQQKDIDDWERVVRTIQAVPNVALVNPVVRQQGFASKGGHSIGVSVVGADPRLQDGVTPVSKYMVEGRYHGLGSDEVVVDTELATDLSVEVGDRIRLASNTGASDSFTVVGIYSRGQGRGDAYLTLRTAQSLFGLGTAVNLVFVKLRDIYQADQAADRIMALLPYEAKSWSREFPLFLDRLRMQTATAYLISGFSLVASSFAIASVLIVSVLQKSKQIGILKAIGARRGQILRIFVLEGLGIAVVGSVVGASVGTLIIYLLGLIEQPPYRPGQPPEQFFPVAVLPRYIGLTMALAIGATVLAAVLPARRAASLNPVDVMR